MKKMKALFLSLALGFTFAAVGMAVGCKGNDAPSSSSYEWTDGGDENVISIRFQSVYAEVEQYASKNLGCYVKGTTAAVEYKSSDEAIATVDANGVVTTYGVLGKATITATVEGISATCEVNVVKSPYVPKLVFEATEYTIETGETLQFVVATEWNNVELTEDITYAVSLAEGYEGVTAVPSVSGNVVTVTAGETVETVEVIISTTVRDIYTSERVMINVEASKLKLTPTSTDFIPEQGKYVTQIYTTSQVDAANVDRIPLSFAVTKGGVEKDVAIDWEVKTIADERTLKADGKTVQEAATVEDNVLIAKRRGSVIVTGTATVDGETATIDVFCEIVPPEVKLTQTAELEVANLGILTIEENLIGELERAEYNGKKVNSLAVDKKLKLTNYATEADALNKTNPLFPSSGQDLGRKELIIYTDLVRYTMDVDVYTMIINDADELDLMREVAYTGEMELNTRYNEMKSSEYFDGYFVLGNDIDYNRTIKSMTDTGSVWWCQGYTDDFTRGFRGVFDGKGYNIDGVTVGLNTNKDQSGGMFGYLSKTGTVKNVSFTNATLLANQGFICASGDGTIENVSISYKKIGGDKETNMNVSTPRTMGSFFSYKSGTNAVVRNCLIDASAADITEETGWYNGTKTYNIKLAGTATTMENVIVICPNKNVLDASGANVTRLTYNDVMKEPDLFKNFDREIWTITEEGIPMFVNQAETIDKDASIEFLNVDDTLVAGFEMLILTNNPYVKIEINEIAGVTFENSLLKAKEEAFEKTVTLTATSLLNPEITVTHNVYIDSFGKEVVTPQSPWQPTVYNTNNVLEVGDNSWKGEENYVYLGAHVISNGNGAEEITVDLDKLQWGDNDVTVVSIKNGEREHFNLNLKKWYTAGNFADSEIISDALFNERREYVDAQGHTITFTEVATEEKAAEGYEKVTQLNCGVEWESALMREMFDMTEIRGYSDLWFGIKITNGRFIAQTVEVQAAGWVYFHYTQTSDGVWVAEVTKGDEVYKTEFDIKDMGGNGTMQRVCDLLYRSGWSNGFLWYNNGSGGTVTETTPTSFYITELRGTKKAQA